MLDKTVIETEISCDSLKCLLGMADRSLPFLGRDIDPNEMNFLINKALTLQAQQATETDGRAIFYLDDADADYLDGLAVKKGEDLGKEKYQKKYSKRLVKAANRLLDAEREKYEWYNRPAEEEIGEGCDTAYYTEPLADEGEGVRENAEAPGIEPDGAEAAETHAERLEEEPEERLSLPEPGRRGFPIHIRVTLCQGAADALAAQEEAGLSRKEAIEQAVQFLAGENRKGPNGSRRAYFGPGISGENMDFLRERAAGGHGYSAVLSAAIRRERPKTKKEKKLEKEFKDWLEWH